MGMSVQIKCPTCGGRVTIIRDGYVAAHKSGLGPCTFTRTAHSTPRSGVRGARGASSVSRQHSAQSMAKRVAAVAQEAAEVAQKAADRKERKRSALERKAAQTRIRYVCPCGIASYQIPNEKGLIRAHLRADSNRWCRGGEKPTEAERKKVKPKKKGSVWTVSGGLPTLGRQ